jgi:putative transposase
MHFYVPNDSVRIICYEMGEDHTDSRMAGQITDRTHLAYAVAYGFKYFISTDTLIKSYQLPHALTKYGFSKPEIPNLGGFRDRVLDR